MLGDEPFDAALGADDLPATLIRGTDLGDVGTLVVQPGRVRRPRCVACSSPSPPAVLLVAGTPGVVTANEPVAGHDDRYPHPTNAPPITLEFHVPLGRAGVGRDRP